MMARKKELYAAIVLIGISTLVGGLLHSSSEVDGKNGIRSKRR